MPQPSDVIQAAMDSANAVTDRVVACATARGFTLTDEEAELIECYLAAHFYQTSDPGYSSRSTANKSGAFLDDPKDMQTRYLERALLLDYSGCLRMIFKRNFASAFWLGKTESEQLSYCERN